MARKKNRMGILKRQREQRKAEKREQKRLRRIQRKDLAEADGLPESKELPDDVPVGEDPEDVTEAPLRSEPKEVLDETE